MCPHSLSWSKKQDLNEAQRELKLPQHCLVTDCQTRWGSMQKMVSRILEQQKAIHKVLHDDRNYHHLVPMWQDIHVLLSLVVALRILSGFTYMLSTENLITVSVILPVINRMCDDDTKLRKDIKTRILSYLEQKYTDVEICEFLNLATFLDPHFITEYVNSTINH